MALSRYSRFLWWPLCWASLAAAMCGFLFYWSTLPVADPTEVPGTAKLTTIAYLALLAYLLNVVSSIPLFIIGLDRLRPRRRLMIAWAATVAAGVLLELALFLMRWNPSVGHSTPFAWAWGYLALASGDLIVGAILTHIVISAAPTPARQLPASPLT